MGFCDFAGPFGVDLKGNQKEPTLQTSTTILTYIYIYMYTMLGKHIICYTHIVLFWGGQARYENLTSGFLCGFASRAWCAEVSVE